MLFRSQSLSSLRELYGDRKITAVFQPHLYSRTHDFYREFADSLSVANEVILTEIYPARELPIPGVTSQLIYDNLKEGVEKMICEKKDLPQLIAERDTDIVVLLGAGDIDNYADQLVEVIKQRNLTK